VQDTRVNQFHIYKLLKLFLELRQQLTSGTDLGSHDKYKLTIT